MAFIPAPQRVVRVRAHWVQGAATAENVFYVSLAGSGAITTSDCSDVCAQVAHAYNIGGGADVMDALTGDTTLVQLDAEEAAVQFGHHFSSVLNIPGRDTSKHALAPGVALVVTLQTQLRGRSFRGRLFQIGAAEENVDASGIVASTPLAAYQTAFNNWLAGIQDGAVATTTLGVNSYFSGNAPRGVSVFTGVTSVLVRPHVHSQRRRNLP